MIRSRHLRLCRSQTSYIDFSLRFQYGEKPSQQFFSALTIRREALSAIVNTHSSHSWFSSPCPPHPRLFATGGAGTTRTGKRIKLAGIFILKIVFLQDVLSYQWCRADNDQNAHLNNVTSNALFDSVLITFLIAHCELRPTSSPAIAIMTDSRIAYFAELSFPARLAVGLRALTMGTHSATYEGAVFKEDAEVPAVVGVYTLVYVDRETRKTVLLPDVVRRGLQTIVVPNAETKAKM
jgi:acyl-CoA thioester hydrolase